MTQPPSSKSAADRETGKHQVDEQRAIILDAAEKLFLQNGLENTNMVDIARQAGITRVTLYRYFANRDEIAVEIQMRMFKKIASAVPEVPPGEMTLESHRRRAQITIRSFPQLRDAYRYIGMFDKIYLDNDSNSALTQWTLDRLRRGRPPRQPLPNPSFYKKELPVIVSTITWFLEKLALRGELTWSDPDIPLEEHLKFFEEMIMRAFDQLEE